MKDPLTIYFVMQRAIEKEIEAQEMYRDLSGMVTEKAAKDMFVTLRGVEKKHEDLLRQYQAGQLGEGSLKPDHVVDYHIAEHLETPEVTPDMALDEVLLLAANREKASYDLYMALAAEHEPGEVKTLFEDLAEQEIGHKQRVEEIYTEVAFPQTSGG